MKLKLQNMEDTSTKRTRAETMLTDHTFHVPRWHAEEMFNQARIGRLLEDEEGNLHEVVEISIKEVEFGAFDWEVIIMTRCLGKVVFATTEGLR